MLSIFVNVVLPVFLVAGLGFVFEKRFRPPIGPFNQLALFILMPALVFQSLLTVDFRSEEPLRIAAFVILLAVVMLAVALAIARIARLDRPTASAFMLTAAFPNLGNYGLPVVALAFGQEGLVFGTLLLAVQSVYSLTLAVVIASSSNATLTSSLRQVLKQSVLYASIAGLVLNFAHVALPQFVISAIALPAQAAIPVMLIVLGLNLATTTRMEQPALVSLAVATRLVLGPLVGWLLAEALGLGGVARGVAIVGSAMPTGVFTILTATQFNARPRFVSNVVVASTIVSIVTVTAVLAILSGAFSFV
ncbi:MAG: AEC family transporter [Chloroflexota bacterium]|nr:AEC family transporter [Chloroflexota bacterium]